MKILFAIIALLISQASFSQISMGEDSIPILIFKFNPLVCGTENEVGITAEYSRKTNFSIEFGLSVGPPLINLDKVSTHGLLLQSGIRYYKKSGIYLNPLFFYRYKYYHNRHYEWNRDNPEGKVMETSPDPIGPGSGTDYWTRETADESKHVFAFQCLIGREVPKFRKIPIDVYFGVGVRYKFRFKEISYHYENGYTYGTGMYSPPLRKDVNIILPTVHAGIRFGIAFKFKKININ